MAGRRCGAAYKRFPLTLQEPLHDRREEGACRQPQDGLPREQLEPARGREQVDVPPRHALRGHSPGAQSGLVGRAGYLDASVTIRHCVGEHDGSSHR
jgi:hypothetical protein